MKSGKQRRSELKVRKQSRQTKVVDRENAALEIERQAMLASKIADGKPIVDLTALAPNHTYDVPDFVKLGYYLDRPFNCAGCHSPELWTAAQQKWWYEEAKGGLWTIAKFCRTCRHQERIRRDEARRIHLEGMAKKQQRHQAPIPE
jgi:Probable zinc-ribbon domain